MNEQLKALRKYLSLNQSQMADRMKLSRSHISSLENGAREITDRIIHDICREFNVNEEWLRTGEGDPFFENDDTIIAELAAEYNLTPIDQKIIEHFVKLDEQSRNEIKEHILSLAEQINSLEETAASSEIDIDKEVESYRRELEEEKKGKMLSVSAEQKEKYNANA